MRMELVNQITIGGLVIKSDLKVNVEMKNGTILKDVKVDFSQTTGALLDYESQAELYVNFDEEDGIADENGNNEFLLQVSEIKSITEVV